MASDTHVLSECAVQFMGSAGVPYASACLMTAAVTAEHAKLDVSAKIQHSFVHTQALFTAAHFRLPVSLNTSSPTQ